MTAAAEPPVWPINGWVLRLIAAPESLPEMAQQLLPIPQPPAIPFIGNVLDIDREVRRRCGRRRHAVLLTVYLLAANCLARAHGKEVRRDFPNQHSR